MARLPSPVVRRQLLPPLSRLVRHAPLPIEPHQPSQGFERAPLLERRRAGVPRLLGGHQSLVASRELRLGLLVLLLAEQARAEKAFRKRRLAGSSRPAQPNPELAAP